MLVLSIPMALMFVRWEFPPHNRNFPILSRYFTGHPALHFFPVPVVQVNEFTDMLVIPDPAFLQPYQELGPLAQLVGEKVAADAVRVADLVEQE